MLELCLMLLLGGALGGYAGFRLGRSYEGFERENAERRAQWEDGDV